MQLQACGGLTGADLFSPEMIAAVEQDGQNVPANGPWVRHVPCGTTDEERDCHSNFISPFIESAFRVMSHQFGGEPFLPAPLVPHDQHELLPL